MVRGGPHPPSLAKQAPDANSKLALPVVGLRLFHLYIIYI